MAPSEPAFAPMSTSNEDKGPAVLGAVLSVIVVATLLVVARLYARGRLLKRYFLDDYFVVLGLVSLFLRQLNTLNRQRQSAQSPLRLATILSFPNLGMRVDRSCVSDGCSPSRFWTTYCNIDAFTTQDGDQVQYDSIRAWSHLHRSA